MDSINQSKWFVCSKKRLSAKMRLFCLPYAGGNASTYLPWEESLPEFVKLIAIQPPGRANRICEAKYTSMYSLVTDMYQAIEPYLDKPYVIFGHSVGSRVGFELVRSIKQNGKLMPIHFFASGSRAPNICGATKKIYNLPESEFIKELMSFNGTPKELFKNRELLSLLIPLLRADFQISEDYQFTGDECLKCDLSIFSGESDDSISESELIEWKRFFNGRNSSEVFQGGHFFIQQDRDSVVRKISTTLNNILLHTMGHNISM
ncbi:thioesterase II family protein [Microbulbifer epialgicus]|uniref:Thioesterase II family protein n=1 Tax=Microbulbifer epialgicus TaxID=393907 RepID=A0ABV4P3A0_9GAMM